MSERTHRINYEKYIKELAEFMDANGCKLRPFPKYRVSKEKQNPLLGKTAYYDPTEKTVTIFTDSRLLKDVLRSIAHENVHHHQNLEGRLVGYNGDTLGQDSRLDELEAEAYLKGNILFRKWTETKSKSEKPEKSFTKHMKKKVELNENKKRYMKQTVHLNETEFKQMLGKIVEEVYHNNIGGGPLGSSDNYMGIDDVKIIWHGEWSDPELKYNGYVVNYYTVEDNMYEMAKSEGIDDNGFPQYVRDNADEVRELIMNYGEPENYDELNEKKNMKKTIRLKESELKSLIKNIVLESMGKQVLNEGPGAGYTMKFKGLSVTNVQITGDDGEQIHFTADLKPGVVKWSAEGYYGGPTSEGVWYDNAIVEEYDDVDNMVNGGKVEGYIYKDELYEGRPAEYTIASLLSDFGFEQMVGGGYTHMNLDNPMAFNDVEVKDAGGYIFIDQIQIDAKNIVENTNWWFENWYRFDEIYNNDEDYDDDMINEAVRRVVRKLLKEGDDNSPYSEVDRALSMLGDARVSNFYSGDGVLTVSASMDIDKNQIIDTMSRFGYELYDIGGNGDRRMFTFEDVSDQKIR